jgi:hypothetical protein
MKKLKRLIETDILKDLTSSSSSFLVRSNYIAPLSDSLDLRYIRSFSKVQATRMHLSAFLNFSLLKFPLDIVVLDTSKPLFLGSKNLGVVFAKVKTFAFNTKTFNNLKVLNSNFVLRNLVSCLTQKISLVRLLKISLDSKN